MMRYDTASGRVSVGLDEVCHIAFNSVEPSARVEEDGAEWLQSAEKAKLLAVLPSMADYIREEVSGEVNVSDVTFLLHDTLFTKFEAPNTLSVRKVVPSRSRGFFTLTGEARRASVFLPALLAAKLYRVEKVRADLVLFDPENGKISEGGATVQTSMLEKTMRTALERVLPRARLCREKTVYLLPEIKVASFPYATLRAGQRELIEHVYVSISSGKRLIANAPTGIGKTISTLYPAVKAIGDGKADKIFYLTAKASTRRDALAACARIVEQHAPIRSMILYSKGQLCCNESLSSEIRFGRHLGSYCLGGCSYLRSYEQKLALAIREALSSSYCFDRTVIESIAKKYQICPFEFSLDLSEYCDVIICDYNYVFDPGVCLERYFKRPNDEKFVFLVDEAHNLSDRMCEAYSALLDGEDFKEFYTGIPDGEEKLREACEDVLRCLFAMRKLCRDNLQKDANGQYTGCFLDRSSFPELTAVLQTFRSVCADWKKENKGEDLPPYMEEVVDAVDDYLAIAVRYDKHYAFYYEIVSGHVKVRLLCLDASDFLSDTMDKAVSTVLFSATLCPIDYFADILGVGNKARKLVLPSPFDEENLGIFAVTGVSTRFDDREKSRGKILSCLAAAIAPKVGNYMVYFPSYKYMKEIQSAFSAKFPGVRTVVQKPDMTLAEKEAFLASFRESSGKMLVGFCVLGGSFSEGIDLPGNALIGTVIVGVGIPGLSDTRNILRDYYENKNENGYTYAYVYPGMNKVMQAAGRVIRTETDRGIVVLIDDRYGEPAYREMFPSHWSSIQYADKASSLAELTANFWKKP